MSDPASAPQIESEREYPYRASWRVIILGAIFFGACAVVLGYEAADNRRGLILDGLPLTAGQATDFYAVLAALSAGFVTITLVLGFRRMSGAPGRIVLGRSAMIAPNPRWRPGEQAIAYASITGLSLTTTGRQVFLTIDHEGGRFQLARSMLPSRAAFDEIRTFLAQRARRGAR